MSDVKVGKMSWFVLSLVGLFGFAIMMLLIKFVFDKNVESATIYFYMSIFGAIMALAYILIKGISIQINTGTVALLLVAAFLAVIANIAMIQAAKEAPNPGYAIAITNANIVIVVIAAAIIFKSELNFIKILGTVFAMIGIILLGI